MALGHELAGIVEWVGSEVTDVAVGERVVVHPGDDELGRLGSGSRRGRPHPAAPRPPSRAAAAGCSPSPTQLPLTVAALAEPTAVSMQAVNQAEVRPGDTVAVFGCGPIGLLAIATLADRGIADVVAIDLEPAPPGAGGGVRRRPPARPGDDDVWSELARLHGTAPFMFGPDAGDRRLHRGFGLGPRSSATFSSTAASAAGCPWSPCTTNRSRPTTSPLLMKQFTIRGSFEYPPRFEDAIELLDRRDLSALVTHTFPLEDFGDGLEPSSKAPRIVGRS